MSLMWAERSLTHWGQRVRSGGTGIRSQHDLLWGICRLSGQSWLMASAGAGPSRVPRQGQLQVQAGLAGELWPSVTGSEA